MYWLFMGFIGNGGDQDNQPLIFYKLRIPSTLMEIMNIVRYTLRYTTYIRYVVGTLDSVYVLLSFPTLFIVYYLT